jgi:hypothetical protein
MIYANSLGAGVTGQVAQDGAGGCTTKPVNRASYSDTWVSLGTYTFAGTSFDHVYLSNATGSCCTQTVALDAVEWIPKSQ